MSKLVVGFYSFTPYTASGCLDSSKSGDSDYDLVKWAESVQQRKKAEEPETVNVSAQRTDDLTIRK
ncbi:MAG: hypothetical protein A2W80_13710 [Candidatus Riflebacteria bacterium GWC2_50_8]|nr:MAG: hypothetical protein A2W80_13710 [Candidatus Riflebacteria bacterium GWC2_50_8]